MLEAFFHSMSLKIKEGSTHSSNPSLNPFSIHLVLMFRYLLFIKFVCQYFVRLLFLRGRCVSWHGRVQSWGSNQQQIWRYYIYFGSSNNHRTTFLVVNQILYWFVATSLLSYFHLSHSRSFLHSLVYFLRDVGNHIKSTSLIYLACG